MIVAEKRLIECDATDPRPALCEHFTTYHPSIVFPTPDEIADRGGWCGVAGWFISSEGKTYCPRCAHHYVGRSTYEHIRQSLMAQGGWPRYVG